MNTDDGFRSGGFRKRKSAVPRRLIILGLIVGWPTAGRTQESELESSRVPPSDAVEAVQDGLLLPSALTPKVGSVPAFASAYAGYDSAKGAPIGTVVAEARVWGPFALRGGAEYSATTRSPRPTVGARVQLLQQERHGIDGAVSIFYRPEGFTEPEGEVETFVSIARRQGPVVLVGNFVYGQDPEGNERDGEVRFASLWAFGRMAAGIDSRFRFAIGEQKGPAREEPKFDLLAGPVATATVGPVAMFAEAGLSLSKVTTTTAIGMAALGGVAKTF